VHPDKPELGKLQLRLGDPKLRKDKHKDNEAIQFEFDLVKDNPEKISKELVSGKLHSNETTRSTILGDGGPTCWLCAPQTDCYLKRLVFNHFEVNWLK
jgi:hypothetical protein